ncbi:hypothetical protein C7212DRAFT_300982 [Tuber magnatum]|uniref:HTH CENPB-type domain-containing protein n=1 Tax=Tuber magnatum TaxID=42249 RepID=A0A317SIP0_9PEZI|nr:hypothetical protein C7212DRAFT_300982 [Tuber magnatum]
MQQQQPVPIAPNYLGLPHWGQTMIPPQPSGAVSSHPQFVPSPAIAAPNQPTLGAPLSMTQSGHSTQSTSSPRRTLTDADRRRMCIFHEENPNVKQTEIGAMFGVERSTVSKVLRQKEKYLFPDDGSRSPVKRSKGKFPDIERALAVWAKNTRKQGVALTDMMIREKAKFFATSVGISDSQFKANGQGWLEKFKQKNNLHSNGRGRSESDVTGVARLASGGLMSPKPGHSRTDSTPVLGSPMMQESKSQDSSHNGTDSPESFMEFGGFIKQQVSAFDYAGPVSPTSPFFSPDQRAGSMQARMPHLQHRPRSQTFPTISVDPTYISPPPSSEPLTPKTLNQAVVPPPALASPAPDPPNPLASPNHTPSSPHGALAAQTPQSPTREDACRALEVVLTYLRRQPVGYVEPDDYLVVGKLLARIGLDNMESNEKIGVPP